MTGALIIDRITAGYDQADVLSDVSIKAEPGRITCILGSNGAGKTTLIRAILRLTPPRRGTVSFEGEHLDGLKTHQIIARGISCIPEGRRIFARMSVEENLRVGAYLEPRESAIRDGLARVYESFPRLKERRRQLAGTMSGGEQAMVSIGRGLMSSPKLLIIDEPSLGLSPLFVQENFAIIERINRDGITVLLVEQNVSRTLAISHFGYVLAQGRVVAAGTATELFASDEVQQAYFGTGADRPAPPNL